MKAYGWLDKRFHIFLTSALVGGEWIASHTGRFTPGEIAPVPIGYEVGWTPEPVWATWEEKILDLTGTRTPTTLSSST
jgi:hypothetical protein